MTLKETLYSEILPRITKPSRYLGTELNAIHKDPADVDLRVCLFFPDLYELGLGNLGLHILYAILNDLDYVWAERGYSPAPDMEAMLRGRGLPLFLHESKEPLREAHLIGFTMQSELTYTNILNALDLASIPLRSEDRSDADPLIFAGGPTSYNPEPMAPFIDFFVIGDGEEAVTEIAEALRPLRDATRREKIEAVAKIDGVYAPMLYPLETLPDGRIVPQEDAPKIVKRITRDLDTARFPVRYIVPYTQLVHDGIGLEVLRGCTQGCRFCQAGMVTRPVRERTIETVGLLMDETLQNTGLEAVSLVSLSTCDHSRSRLLVEDAAGRAHGQKVSVSLPSLRLDSFAVELADQVADMRRSGLTFAPEAATSRLRTVINKFIPDEELIVMSEEAFRRGWTSVKTYFMIGLPTERDEDVEAIAELTIRVLKAGRRISNRAMVRTGVSTFVPKPATPFQWAPQIGIEETRRRQALLSQRFRKHNGIKFGRHAVEASFIEGLIGRADRRVADVIEAAWRHGAKLETWDEHVSLAPWRQAIEETGFDADAQFAARPLDARLPWDHIDCLVEKDWLRADWDRAMLLRYAQDCRAGKCHQCGVISRERGLCKHMLKNQRLGRKEEAAAREATTTPIEPPEETPREPIQRIRFRIGRSGEVRFLSHLEMQSAWVRALRRAGLPLAYSQGFHAHAKVTFATALPVGEESKDDFMDVVLDQFVPPGEAVEELRGALPPGFHVYSAEDVPLRGPSLMSIVGGFRYILSTEGNAETLARTAASFLGQDSIAVKRKAKARRRGRGRKEREIVEIDIRPMIVALTVTETQGRAEIVFETRLSGGRAAKPRDVVELLELDPQRTRIVKQATLLDGTAGASVEG